MRAMPLISNIQEPNAYESSSPDMQRLWGCILVITISAWLRTYPRQVIISFPS